MGPLVGLRRLQVEDTIEVAVVGGMTRKYAVTKVVLYDGQSLPQSLFLRPGAERLHLITCRGAYDADQDGYQKHLVVAAPIG